MDPLLDIEAWRLAAHGVVPIVIAAAVKPTGSNRFRGWLSVAAAGLIQLVEMGGIDFADVADVDSSAITRALLGIALGFGGQSIAYQAADTLLLPDGQKLNDRVLPEYGLTHRDYVDI